MVITGARARASTKRFICYNIRNVDESERERERVRFFFGRLRGEEKCEILCVIDVADDGKKKAYSFMYINREQLRVVVCHLFSSTDYLIEYRNPLYSEIGEY